MSVSQDPRRPSVGDSLRGTAELNSEWCESADADPSDRSAVDDHPGDYPCPAPRRPLADVPVFATNSLKSARIFMYAAVILLATGLGTATYLIASNKLQAAFESEFQALGKQFLRAEHRQVQTRLDILQHVSESITSSASNTNATWPFVSVAHFEEKTSKLRQRSNLDAIVFAPLFSVEDTEPWEAMMHAKVKAFPSAEKNNSESLFYLFKLSAYVAPVQEVSPVENNDIFSEVNHLSQSTIDAVAVRVLESRQPVFSGPMERSPLSTVENNEIEVSAIVGPSTFVMYPVFADFIEPPAVAGVVLATFSYKRLIGEPPGKEKSPLLVAVVSTSCGLTFTLESDGSRATFRGYGDLHDTAFNNFEMRTELSGTPSVCSYGLRLFPTEELYAESISTAPLLYAFANVIFALLVLAAIATYDLFVGNRHNKQLQRVAQTQSIASSFFPYNAKDGDGSTKQTVMSQHSTNLIRDFLEEDFGTPREEVLETMPIADLFLETTVMHADIVGFTAWSSMREPSQIFTLLETVYAAFDEIAKRRRIFKIESIGDCYVAVAGLPEPRCDHAVAMARFARDCLVKMNSLAKKLEVALGPDTGELGLRIGLHSGQVTAGVLRGDRERFQLFGDTANTAAHMEMTGQRNRIQASQETADLLTASGRQHWAKARKDLVYNKGMGNMQTYWLEITTNCSQSSFDSNISDDLITVIGTESLKISKKSLESKHQRLINWNASLLLNLLRAIVANRGETSLPNAAKSGEACGDKTPGLQNGTVLDEVVELIRLSKYVATVQLDPDLVVLSPAVEEQMLDYVQTIAALYRDNPFHNFEHASHVTMSAVKLLSRIVASDMDTPVDQHHKNQHDHTYGITSDPLTQFAVVLSALIHDVDHGGVPNAQLCKENASVAAVYQFRSVAEQNSVDIAWNLLMDDRFADLRRAIYQTTADLQRFRQLVVNSVMATDIMDKELGLLRKARWSKAFALTSTQEDEDVAVDRKATIVMEHLIQASDVAHTMQHWHVYRKWNERLFREMYQAYKAGRAETDPSATWYEGEIGFLDYYVIPLARKLKACGVFGVSSDEYLDYAQQNRREWEAKGREVVAVMLESCEQDFASRKDWSVKVMR